MHKKTIDKGALKDIISKNGPKGCQNKILAKHVKKLIASSNITRESLIKIPLKDLPNHDPQFKVNYIENKIQLTVRVGIAIEMMKREIETWL